MTGPEPLTDRGHSICRGCGAAALRSVLDLGEQPVSNRLLQTADAADPRFPLHLRVCAECGLGQLAEYLLPEQLFDDEYPYLSSMSTSWLAHAHAYADHLYRELGLGSDSLVVEVASNDGYLLSAFADLGVRVLGIEPAGNVADLAIGRGVPTRTEFFGVDSARRLVDDFGRPRLVTANNVLAHVPDIADFMGGFAELCDARTVITVENPSFVQLLREAQFDTIYHEHFSYLSAHAVRTFAKRAGIELWRVEALPTHGGSNRYWLGLAGQRPIEDSVDRTIEDELAGGILDPEAWADFARRSRAAIEGLGTWLTSRAGEGRRVVGYGAAAKGNTFLNAVGEPARLIASVVDASPEKQGRFLPGSGIPVLAPEELAAQRPDDVLILPWNLATEISEIVAERVPEAQCWIAIPEVRRVP